MQMSLSLSDSDKRDQEQFRTLEKKHYFFSFKTMRIVPLYFLMLKMVRVK